MNGSLGGSLPIASSDLAQAWDNLYIFLFYVCVFFFVIVFGAMLVFSIKYRAKPGRQSTHITHNDLLEFVWTAIPTVLVTLIFVWGWIVYKQMYVQIPTDAMEVKVVGQQWSWTFQYDDGKTLTNQLVVPKGKPVKLLLTSKLNDVLHSFFIPNMRIKRDAVPGMYTTAWFNANKVGQHQIYCTEYCGTGHSDMLAKLVVLEPEQYNLWKWGAKVEFPPFVGVGGLAITNTVAVTAKEGAEPTKTEPASLVAQGRSLASSKGCVACHSDDGSKRVGPSYKGLFGSEVELSNGTKVVADENYIRESISNPQAKVVKGFETMMMPPYVGQIDEAEMNAIIEYMKSVR